MRSKTKAFGFLVLPVVAGVSLVGDSHATVIQRGVQLTSIQENPQLDTTGFGGASVVIDTDANTLSYRIAYGALSAAESAAHIHGPADPGVNAGVVHTLPAGNPKVGVWNYPEGSEADILSGRMYFNIHTSAHPGGEIRGQISGMSAFIDAAQEVPPTGTLAHGSGIFNVNTDTNALSYFIRIEDLSAAETAAHIHGFSLHGTNSGVIHTLPAGSPKVGVFNYLESQEEAILSGKTYVNVHTSAFPGGECRGQIVPVVVPMDALQEVPPNGSTAAGVGRISYDATSHDLSYDIQTTGLSAAETAAHIHGFAAPGVNAGVLHTLPAGARKLGVWNFGAAASQAQVFAGLTYLNVHTGTNPGGEIRGQVTGFYFLQASDVSDSGTSLPNRLSQSFPNPFGSDTTIRFNLEQAGAVRLAVYDSQGRLVRDVADGDFVQGSSSVRWDGLDNAGQPVASGVYRYVLQTPRGDESGRLTLVR